jgi:signal transduction histidine kinase
VLEKLEESRPLNTPEKCFRDILKNHFLNLLQHQKDYWKKRYTVRWTKLGDESTNFFHVAATKRYRLNTITSLDDDDGRTITNHDKKVALLWEEYKNMLGCTQNTQMHFNMIDLLQTQNLDHITEPFTKVQIDAVVANMPLDKAP